MHLMNVVGGEDTKRVFVYLILKMKITLSLKLVFFTIPSLCLSEKDDLHEQQFLSIFGPHIPWKVLQKHKH